jgi:hypothetical protein
MADKIFINPPLTALNHVYGFTGETLVTSPIPSMILTGMDKVGAVISTV